MAEAKSHFLVGLVAAAATNLVASTCFAAPIIVTLDYQAIVSGTTDTITGTLTYDPTAQTYDTNVTVAGGFGAGTYKINFLVFTPAPSSGATIGRNAFAELDGFFSPNTFSSSITFTEFQFDQIGFETNVVTDSTSVVNLSASAVPEPSSLVLLLGGAIGLLGLTRRKRA